MTDTAASANARYIEGSGENRGTDGNDLAVPYVEYSA